MTPLYEILIRRDAMGDAKAKPAAKGKPAAV